MTKKTGATLSICAGMCAVGVYASCAGSPPLPAADIDRDVKAVCVAALTVDNHAELTPLCDDADLAGKLAHFLVELHAPPSADAGK